MYLHHICNLIYFFNFCHVSSFCFPNAFIDWIYWHLLIEVSYSVTDLFIFFMPLLWLCKSVSNLALVQNDMSCHCLLICPPGYNYKLQRFDSTCNDKHDFLLTFPSRVFCLYPGKSSAVAAAGQRTFAQFNSVLSRFMVCKGTDERCCPANRGDRSESSHVSFWKAIWSFSMED